MYLLHFFRGNKLIGRNDFKNLFFILCGQDKLFLLSHLFIKPGFQRFPYDFRYAFVAEEGQGFNFFVQVFVYGDVQPFHCLCL